jgi:hypothetical protein
MPWRPRWRNDVAEGVGDAKSVERYRQHTPSQIDAAHAVLTAMNAQPTPSDEALIAFVKQADDTMESLGCTKNIVMPLTTRTRTCPRDLLSLD